MLAFLIRAGYGVEVTRGTAYDAAYFRGKNVVGGLASKECACNTYLDDRLAADHSRCFDKYSKCPLAVKLPETDEEALKIVSYLAWLGTDEALRWSNAYGYLHDPRLPRELSKGVRH